MKDTYTMFAKYNQAGNKAVYAIVDKLSPEEREQDRGSYYGSLSGMVRHLLGGTVFFQGLFRGALSGTALEVLAPVASITIPEGTLTDAQWKLLGSAFEVADEALVKLVSGLTGADFNHPVPINWYGGNPPSVPLSFLLNQLVVHGTHHRGQISQVLDAMKIDNDYSGIKVEFLGR
ncbi:MAG: damage-inducible protein DinB [Treponema sp.]|jgi:uncharacterized damage-inducible protein DinB|nr:damage-inducible protein DinB [Treponema sp.]